MQDEEYPIAWKSIEAGRVDYVNATAADKTEFPGFIGFKTPSMPMASQPADKEAEKQMNLVGGIAGQTDQLIAFVLKEDEKGNEIEHELGLLNVVSYAKVRNKVVLVPVNGATVPANVKTEINAVFAQSVAEWDVVIDAGYRVDPSILEKLEEGESGMLASFPKNMRDFIQTFKKERDEDKNAYYLFIIPGKQSTRAGFMPFKRQFGFIYPANTNNTARTIAHELAHGAFRLRHTFSPEAFIAGQGSTNNLMDYPAGPELRKYQWDNVHEPESMNGWFEDDAEVAYYNASVIDIWKKNLYNLACASSRGENLADINVFYELAKGKDSDGFRHPIKFEFYNSIEVEVKVYQLPAIKEYVVDLSTKSKVVSNGKTEISFGLKGTTSKVYFVINSNDAPLFESTISSPPSGLFQQLVDNIPTSEGDGAYSALSSLPPCAFELISAKKRIEYIDWMVQDEWITNEHQEDLIIRLLEEVPSSRVAELVSALESYSNWQDLFENFDNIHTYQGLFRAFKNLYNATKTKEELKEIEAVFDFNMLKYTSPVMNYASSLEVSYVNKKVQILHKVTTSQWSPFNRYGTATKTVSIGDLGAFAPVAVIVNDDHTNIGLQPGTELRSIPAILVAFLIEKKDSENNKDLVSAAADIGLLLGGVGEINLAIRTYQEVRTVRTLFRLTLAVADMATVFADLACKSNDTELCQKWKEVAFYVQIGLLTFNAADGLEALIKRSDNVVKAGLWLTLENEIVLKLSSSIDATTLKKMIFQMKNAGDEGMRLALRIEKGTLEGVDGYTDLIKFASVDNHSLKSVNQALDKADELIINGKENSLLRFEDTSSGYDIDLGLKTSSSSSTYSEVFQFKTNTAPLSKGSIESASKQLYSAPSDKRIVEFRLADGDNISAIKSNEAVKTEFEFQLYTKGLKSSNNVTIDEFHLVSSTGEKVKVIYQNGNVQFINF